MGSNVPDNYADWDQSEGGQAEHKRRKSKSKSEIVAMIIVHNISNMLLIVPLWMTAAQVLTKHQDLLDQGYAFPEEKQAAGLLLTLSRIMPIIVAVSALTDLILVFQKMFHPWRRILAENQDAGDGSLAVSSMKVFLAVQTRCEQLNK